MLMFTLVFILIILTIYKKVWLPYQYWHKLGVPNRKCLPIVGTLKASIFRDVSFPIDLENIYNDFKTERYLGFYQFFTPILMIRDPTLIKNMSVKHFEHFVDHQSFVSETDSLWQKSMFSLKGEKWKAMRSTLSPAFTSCKMRSMYTLVTECADSCSQYFIKQDREIISLEMKDTFTRLTTDIIASTAFGLSNDSLSIENNEFFLMGQELTDLSGWKSLKFFLYMISPAFENLFEVRMFCENVTNFFRNILTDTIRYRTDQNITRPDMLHLLMEAKKGTLKHDDKVTCVQNDFPSDEESVNKISYSANTNTITDEDITAQAMLFFFAGFDTASTLMCHMAYELALNPNIQSKLQNEIDKTLKNCNGKATYEDVMQMKYMDMVVSETLRKWPPSPVLDRICTKRYYIPAEEKNKKSLWLDVGTVIWIPVYAIHRDPNFFPNPDLFDPERFSNENKANIQPFTYMPFGIGPRNCIGSRLALMENKAVFISLLTHFNIVPVQKTRNPLVLSKKHFNMMAEGGFWVGLERRKNT